MATVNVGEVQQLFLQEMEEMLQQMEEDMLALESEPTDADRVHALFRSFHTLKGGAGLSGLTDLARYTHQAENLLDGVRAGRVPSSPALISALLEALDCLKLFMNAAGGRGGVDADRVQASLTHLARLAGQGEMAPAVACPAAPPAAVSRTAAPLQTYFIRLRFDPGLFATQADPLVLLQDLAALGPLLVFPHPHAVPPLAQLDPRQLYLWWTLLLKTTASRKRLQTILMFFLDGHDVRIDLIDGGPREIVNQLAIDSRVTEPSGRVWVGQPDKAESGGTHPLDTAPPPVGSPPPPPPPP
ncbi:MAG: Hpt domain-containing protein, partial [Magnetococcus sp. DMHC-8]